MGGRSWTPEEEEKLIKLYTTTILTYEHIGRELNRSLDSVQHRIMKLRKEGMLEYRNPNKIKNHYEKDLNNVIRLTPEGAYFITSVLGDGNVRKRCVQFDFRKRDCFEFRAIMCHILNISPPLHICWETSRRKRTHKLSYKGKIQIYSTELVECLAYTYGVPIGAKSGLMRLPRQLMKSADPKIRGAVIRAAYECEGGVNLHESSLCVTIGNKSILFLQDLSELLDSYKIENEIYDIRLKISNLESILKFYEMAYSVFDLKLHVTAKKTGLETLIKLKLNSGCKFSHFFNEIEFKQMLKALIKRKFVLKQPYRVLMEWLSDTYDISVHENTVRQWLKEDKIRCVFNKSRDEIVRETLEELEGLEKIIIDQEK